ncbi:hypothetical protein M9H77_26058 [Catharanthus roseus]|uniref:Uncharacterized protein n=1 Tax=Catharanthus roseus TaxID=4058 RepID=A0ACC0A8R1_CATRO|nr:hypothetical protein M9H77_26058 [Catharanthus roseus]
MVRAEAWEPRLRSKGSSKPVSVFICCFCLLFAFVVRILGNFNGENAVNVYEGGVIDYLDYCHVDRLTMDDIDGLEKRGAHDDEADYEHQVVNDGDEEEQGEQKGEEEQGEKQNVHDEGQQTDQGHVDASGVKKRGRPRNRTEEHEEVELMVYELIPNVSGSEEYDTAHLRVGVGVI